MKLIQSCKPNRNSVHFSSKTLHEAVFAPPLLTDGNCSCRLFFSLLIKSAIAIGEIFLISFLTQSHSHAHSVSLTHLSHTLSPTLYLSTNMPPECISAHLATRTPNAHSPLLIVSRSLSRRKTPATRRNRGTTGRQQQFFAATPPRPSRIQRRIAAGA